MQAVRSDSVDALLSSLPDVPTHVGRVDARRVPVPDAAAREVDVYARMCREIGGGLPPEAAARFGCVLRELGDARVRLRGLCVLESAARRGSLDAADAATLQLDHDVARRLDAACRGVDKATQPVGILRPAMPEASSDAPERAREVVSEAAVVPAESSTVREPALSSAAREGDAIRAQKFLNVHPERIDHQSGARGETALMVALERMHLDVAQVLLEYGANPFVEPVSGSDALDLAVRAPSAEAGRVLLDARPDLLESLAGRRGSGPALPDIIRLLTKRGAVPAHFHDAAVAAVARGDTAAALAYVELAGVPLDTRFFGKIKLPSLLVGSISPNFWQCATLIGLAAWQGHTETVEALLQRCPEKSWWPERLTRQRQREAALTIAIVREHVRLAASLLRQGAQNGRVLSPQSSSLPVPLQDCLRSCRDATLINLFGLRDSALQEAKSRSLPTKTADKTGAFGPARQQYEGRLDAMLE